ncbi:MAG TPA: cytochrome c maturation protein CcmE [Bryobacteraceae bacterium]|nr:cytochrome c maturation protein CcmE [Bryobacteraceae bacterium]
MKRYGKFIALAAIVIGTLVWLAAASMTDNKTYYKTVAELAKMGDQAYGQRIRVGGDVEDNSIKRVGSEVRFVLVQDKQRLTVAYTGAEPLPDTFRGGAQALADGHLDKDGVFRTSKIQAKCASKYAAKVPQTAAPVKSGSSI